MNNVSFKTNNFLLVNQRDEKVEIDDPKKSSGFFDLFISEDLEFQSLIQHGFINESGNICTENLEPFDLPIINEETKKKLYLFLKSKKIKIESTFGVNLPFRVTLEEIFNTLESTSFELVGSGIWFFLGYDYLKLCCKQIQHKDGKILWDCLEPAQKKKLEEKLRKRPSDFDFRIFNDDLNISNKIRDLFIQKCLINKLSPKHICTLLNEYIPDWKTRFKLPNEVKQPKEFYQTLLEIFIYTFAFNKWWVQKDKNAANQSSIFGFTDGNTGFDFLILKKSKDENLTKRYISPKDSIVLSLTFLKQDLNNLEYRDLNLIDSRKLNFLEPSQYYNIDLSSQFESQEFSSNVNNTFSNFLSVGVNSLYNDSRQSLIEVMGNFSTGFEGEPLAREWAVYLKKMTQGQVLNTKGVFKRFFEKECECLKNQNTKKKETLPDLLIKEVQSHHNNDTRALIALFINTLFWSGQEHAEHLLRELHKELSIREKNLDDLSFLFLKEMRQILNENKNIQEGIKKLQGTLLTIGFIEAASLEEKKTCSLGLFEENHVLKMRLKANVYLILPLDHTFDFSHFYSDNLFKQYYYFFSENTFSLKLFEKFKFQISKTPSTFIERLSQSNNSNDLVEDLYKIPAAFLQLPDKAQKKFLTEILALVGCEQRNLYLPKSLRELEAWWVEQLASSNSEKMRIVALGILKKQIQEDSQRADSVRTLCQLWKNEGRLVELKELLTLSEECINLTRKERLLTILFVFTHNKNWDPHFFINKASLLIKKKGAFFTLESEDQNKLLELICKHENLDEILSIFDFIWKQDMVSVVLLESFWQKLKKRFPGGENLWDLSEYGFKWFGASIQYCKKALTQKKEPILTKEPEKIEQKNEHTQKQELIIPKEKLKKIIQIEGPKTQAINILKRFSSKDVPDILLEEEKSLLEENFSILIKNEKRQKILLRLCWGFDLHPKGIDKDLIAKILIGEENFPPEMLYELGIRFDLLKKQNFIFSMLQRKWVNEHILLDVFQNFTNFSEKKIRTNSIICKTALFFLENGSNTESWNYIISNFTLKELEWRNWLKIHFENKTLSCASFLKNLKEDLKHYHWLSKNKSDPDAWSSIICLAMDQKLIFALFDFIPYTTIAQNIGTTNSKIWEQTEKKLGIYYFERGFEKELSQSETELVNTLFSKLSDSDQEKRAIPTLYLIAKANIKIRWPDIKYLLIRCTKKNSLSMKMFAKLFLSLSIDYTKKETKEISSLLEHILAEHPDSSSVLFQIKKKFTWYDPPITKMVDILHELLKFSEENSDPIQIQKCFKKFKKTLLFIFEQSNKNIYDTPLIYIQNILYTLQKNTPYHTEILRCFLDVMSEQPLTSFFKNPKKLLIQLPVSESEKEILNCGNDSILVVERRIYKIIFRLSSHIWGSFGAALEACDICEQNRDLFNQSMKITANTLFELSKMYHQWRFDQLKNYDESNIYHNFLSECNTNSIQISTMMKFYHVGLARSETIVKTKSPQLPGIILETLFIRKLRAAFNSDMTNVNKFILIHKDLFMEIFQNSWIGDIKNFFCEKDDVENRWGSEIYKAYANFLEEIFLLSMTKFGVASNITRLEPIDSESSHYFSNFVHHYANIRTHLRKNFQESPILQEKITMIDCIISSVIPELTFFFSRMNTFQSKLKELTENPQIGNEKRIEMLENLKSQLLTNTQHFLAENQKDLLDPQNIKFMHTTDPSTEIYKTFINPAIQLLSHQKSSNTAHFILRIIAKHLSLFSEQELLNLCKKVLVPLIRFEDFHTTMRACSYTAKLLELISICLNNKNYGEYTNEWNGLVEKILQKHKKTLSIFFNSLFVQNPNDIQTFKIQFFALTCNNINIQISDMIKNHPENDFIAQQIYEFMESIFKDTFSTREIMRTGIITNKMYQAATVFILSNERGVGLTIQQLINYYMRDKNKYKEHLEKLNSFQRILKAAENYWLVTLKFYTPEILD